MGTVGVVMKQPMSCMGSQGMHMGPLTGLCCVGRRDSKHSIAERTWPDRHEVHAGLSPLGGHGVSAGGDPVPIRIRFDDNQDKRGTKGIEQKPHGVGVL